LLHEKLGANSGIEAREVILELEPSGGDITDETAKPTTLDVDDLQLLNSLKAKLTSVTVNWIVGLP